MVLKYRLDRWDETVMFQVIEMHESFRAKQGEINCVHTSALDVESAVGPYLEIDCIFLHGSGHKYDNRVCTLVFNTSEEAEEYVERVQISLREWADRWIACTLEKEGNIYTIS